MWDILGHGTITMVTGIRLWNRTYPPFLIALTFSGPHKHKILVQMNEESNSTLSPLIVNPGLIIFSP